MVMVRSVPFDRGGLCLLACPWTQYSKLGLCGLRGEVIYATYGCIGLCGDATGVTKGYMGSRDVYREMRMETTSPLR